MSQPQPPVNSSHIHATSMLLSTKKLDATDKWFTKYCELAKLAIKNSTILNWQTVASLSLLSNVARRAVQDHTVDEELKERVKAYAREEIKRTTILDHRRSARG
ncbi:hypothetical protein PRZ48_008861 [Zasmidium cellare]|uniref:Uncharacterized protein n=1 Tax=Zasmidium cellare TaxID=395010 RepID=A0ABR0EGN7_ZASCE|nr:hypothetical protein PRZ48_008861 [Zasmidium cellare]